MENQRQFFLNKMFFEKIFFTGKTGRKTLYTVLGLVAYYPILDSIIFFSYSSTTRLAR
jgi:hypothetical protein